MALKVTAARKREDHTFADLLVGREEEFPVLARAARNTIASTGVKVEWIVPGATVPVLWSNYQQIFRHAYKEPVQQGSRGTGGLPDRGEALTKFLTYVEQVLEWGTPAYTYNHEGISHPVSSCGGYRHYLGRDLTDDDLLILRPLQEPILYEDAWDYTNDAPLDTPVFEWLCETSLTVIPGPWPGA